MLLVLPACSLLSLVQPLNCSQVFDPAHLGTLRLDVRAPVARSHWRSWEEEKLCSRADKLSGCSLVGQNSSFPSLLSRF